MLPRQPNQSIIDGFRCLQHVVSCDTAVGVTQLAAELGMEITRMHRLLRTLTHIGLVVQTEGRKYGPGPAIPVLAAQTLHATHFGDRVLPVLDNLRKSIRRTVALGVRWERSVSYLYYGEATQESVRAIGGHHLWPVTRSGLGIAILSHCSDDEVRQLLEGHPTPPFASVGELLQELAHTRAQGYAFVHTIGKEYTLAMALENNPSMALGVTGKLRDAQIKKLLPKLQAALNELDESFALFRVR